MARLRTFLLCALILIVAPSALAGQTPSFEVRARPSEEGGGVVVVMTDLLRDPALRNAVESGLPLRFHLRVELWRKAFFDRLSDAEDHHAVLVQDPIDRDFRLETGGSERRLADLDAAQRSIETALRPMLEPRRTGRFYYLATLEIETLSLSDLEELRRWLRGEVQPAVEGRANPGRAVERGLRRVLVRVIGLPTRRYEARSATFTIP